MQMGGVHATSSQEEVIHVQSIAKEMGSVSQYSSRVSR